MPLTRHQFHHQGLTFSYLDAGGDGKELIALHAHWMEGLTFAPLAEALFPEWRVIALDQRGHGYSDHALTYTREDEIGDVEALFQHLRIRSAVLLGNSVGAVNAFQFAARHPDSARGLIIEDMGVDVNSDLSFSLPWGGTFPTKEALASRIGPRMLPYLEDSIRHTVDGWKLAFDPQEAVVSQQHLNGDHWTDWLATDCPALIIRGSESKVTTASEAEQMAARRPNTRLVTLRGSHVLHVDDPGGFTKAVKEFLSANHL